MKMRAGGISISFGSTALERHACQRYAANGNNPPWPGWVAGEDGVMRCRACGQIITEQATLDDIEKMKANLRAMWGLNG